MASEGSDHKLFGEDVIDKIGEALKCRAVITIKNDTDLTLERSNDQLFFLWYEGYGFVRPPDMIEPHKTVRCLAIPISVKDNPEPLRVFLKYRVKGWKADALIVDIFASIGIANRYGNTGLTSVGKRYFLLQERGGFRETLRGPKSMLINAGFVMGVHPYRGYSADHQIQGVNLTDSPCAVGVKDLIFIFHRGAQDNFVWFTVFKTTDSTYEKDVPNDKMLISGSPTAVYYDNKIFVFHRGRDDGLLWYNVLDPESRAWRGDRPVNNVKMWYSPNVVKHNDKLVVAYHGLNTDKMLFFETDGKDYWTQPKEMPGNILCSESPSLVSYFGRLWCYFQGGDHNGTLWSVEYGNGNFDSPRQVANTALTLSPNAMMSYEDRLYVFHKGSGNPWELWANRWSFQDKAWLGDFKFEGVAMSEAPSAVLVNDKIYIFHQSGGDQRELWYITLPVQVK